MYRLQVRYLNGSTHTVTLDSLRAVWFAFDVLCRSPKVRTVQAIDESEGR